MIDLVRGEGAAGGLRAGLLLLVVLGVVGTALALAFDRHWQSPLQMLPWIVLGAISVVWIALVVRQTRATIWLARGVAVLAIVVAAVGVWQHIDANYNAGTAHGHHAADSDDSDDEETTPSGGHHGDDSDDEAGASGGHHSHDEEATATDSSESEDAESASPDPSLMDAMTGVVGHAPVPAAMAIVPVGLALAFATIGLGGAGRSEG